MAGLHHEPTGTLFAAEEWERVETLLKDFSAPQLFWLSGYLAHQAQQGVAPVPRDVEHKLLIAFGSETGNSKALARQLQQAAQAAGHRATLADLANLKARHLRQAGRVALICSTHGDGEPPITAHDFHDELATLAPGSLKGLDFALLALGDSSYEQFCQAGIEIDQRLRAAGARPLLARVDCDVDFQKPAAAWMESVLAALGQGRAGLQTAPKAAASLHLVSPRDKVDRHAPASAELLEKIKLSQAERPDGIWHLALALEGRCALQPGDALAVLPRNDAVRVDAILELSGLAGDSRVELEGKTLPLREALRCHYDLVIPAKALLEKWAAWHGAAELQALLQGGDAERRQWLKSVQIVDLLRRFPVRPDAAELLACLRPLQPRLYDIANYDGERPGEVQLSVRQYLYPMNGRQEAGVASSYLAQAEPGEKILVYPHLNPRFHLPEDESAPLILVAAGTGIAPYRAFLQQLRAQGSQRSVWIAFQEQCYEEDFLYQREWQEALEEGLVEHFDCSFLQDAPELSAADCLLDDSERLRDWLARGAQLYLAGEKAELQAGERRLQAAVDQWRPQGQDWQELLKQGRVHRNLY